MKIIAGEGSEKLEFSFVREVKERSGQTLELCFQCQKCTAGCPVSLFSDFSPNQVIRLIQFGLKERVLNSNIIWLCISCETCGARCPNGISLARVMDALKEMALERKVAGKEKKTPLFHESFLRSVQANGRVHETLMLARYKIKSRTFFEDMKIGLELMKRKKLPLRPSRIKSRKQIKEVFTRCMDK